jgi:hypothetical protein
VAFKVTIGGVDKTQFVDVVPNPSITMKQNERSTATLRLHPVRVGNTSAYTTYVPNQYDTITIYDVDGTTPMFGGVITQVGTVGAPAPGDTLHFTTLQCIDYMVYTDWSFWTKVYTTSVTLHQVLTDIIADKLGAYGITLDAGQDTGDTFAAFSVFRIKISDMLRTLTTMCSPTRVVKMSPTGALRILVPGTLTAPFAITDGGPNCQSLDWQHTTFTPANYVQLQAGPELGGGPGTPIVNQWIADGTTRLWNLHNVNVHASDVFPGVVNVGGTISGGVIVGGTNEPLFLVGGGGANDIEWDWQTNDGQLNFKGTSLALIPNTTTINLQYAPQYPFTVVATTGATPVIEAQYTDDSQLYYAPAVAEVSGILSRLNQTGLREAKIATWVGGLSPSQGLTVQQTIRGITTETFQVTQVQAVFTEFSDIHGVRLWFYQVTATESLIYQGSYIDQARAIFGGSNSSTTVGGGSGGGSVTTLSSPVYMGGDSERSNTDPSSVKQLIHNAVPYIATGTFTGTLQVKVKARDAGVGVQAIISDGTTDTPTSVATSTSYVDLTASVSIVTGHIYYVYVKTNATGDGYVGYAQLLPP